MSALKRVMSSATSNTWSVGKALYIVTLKPGNKGCANNCSIGDLFSAPYFMNAASSSGACPPMMRKGMVIRERYVGLTVAKETHNVNTQTKGFKHASWTIIRNTVCVIERMVIRDRWWEQRCTQKNSTKKGTLIEKYIKRWTKTSWNKYNDT